MGETARSAPHSPFRPLATCIAAHLARNDPMATHHFQPTHYHTVIGSHPPVLHIANGDTVITTTVDAWGKDASDTEVTPRGNPQTGPFYVDGAEPGDTLVVELDRISPNRASGYT